MDLTKINTLNIVKKNKDPLVSKTIESNIGIVSPTTNGSVTEPTNISIDNNTKIKNLYKDLRLGKIQKNDFDKNLEKIEPRILETINDETRKNCILVLSNTLKWLIQLKLMISTGQQTDSLNNDLFDNYYGENTEYKELGKQKIILDILDFDEDNVMKTTLISSNPKEFSKSIKHLLEVFIGDDILKPKYKVDNILSYLYNERPTFLKEIAVLFDLYSKYFDTISKNLIQQTTNNQLITFGKIKDIQPRFNMINKHILSSNLSNKINYNLDLNKIGVLPEDPNEASKILGISASQLGLKKRLDNLNEWLTNGIIMVQVSINRIHALKPLSSVAADGSVKVGLKAHAAQAANRIYDIWLILEDTKSFLDSLKGLIDGSAFITGVPSRDTLEILDTNF